TSSTTSADRPTRAEVPVRSGGGCLMCRSAIGRTTTSPAPVATANAASWKGRPAPSTPTTAATTAPAAISPRASVVVSTSATPSTAARTSQKIHDDPMGYSRGGSDGVRGVRTPAAQPPSPTVTPPRPCRDQLRAIIPIRPRTGNYGCCRASEDVMTGPAQQPYSHGNAALPLLGVHIGGNLRRVGTEFGGREAVVDVPTGRRWTYAQFDADTDVLA